MGMPKLNVGTSIIQFPFLIIHYNLVDAFQKFRVPFSSKPYETWTLLAWTGPKPTNPPSICYDSIHILNASAHLGWKAKVPWKHQMISFLLIHYIDRRPNQSFPRDYSAKNVSKSIFLRFSCRFRYNDIMSTTSWVMVLLCKSSQSLLSVGG